MGENTSFREILADSPKGVQPSNIDGLILIKDNIVEDSVSRNSFDCGNGELNSEAKTYSDGVLEKLQVSSLVDGELLPDSNNNRGPRLRSHRTFLFNAKELSSSIIASESNRTICAVSIALLVVLSFIDYPLLGINIVNSKSIVAMRPLYMILVTDIVILVTHLVLERRRRSEDSEEDSRGLEEGGLSWERAVRVLERGLVFHQTIRAVFIDFSVYVVIVVCVLSLAGITRT